jgi:hypothetical protein
MKQHAPSWSQLTPSWVSLLQNPVRRWDAPWVTCFNRCSGRGRCIEGFCHCRPGAFGIDCSLSLGPDGTPEVWVDSHTRLARPPGGVRPLVYVYELPPWLNVWLMTHSLVSLDRHEPYQVRRHPQPSRKHWAGPHWQSHCMCPSATEAETGELPPVKAVELILRPGSVAVLHSACAHVSASCPSPED